jgi:oligopeptide/dipeptide ABC transporter ATP-binding protein
MAAVPVVAEARPPLLSIRDLVTVFDTPEGLVRAVDHVSYDVYPGETLGVVGESGSGKSVTAMSVVNLIAKPAGRIAAGEVIFDGRDLLKAGPRELRRIRGADIGFVFQDPMTSLNPVLKVGTQLMEAITLHDRRVGRKAARRRVVELLELVGIPNAGERVDQYPYQFSGGMVQRVMIAMAIANRPKLLIADEPTTALDVSIQAQVLDVLRAAQRETQAATILITHDLGLVAEMCDRVVVMYAGHIVETGEVDDIFHRPRHPYTVGLMASLPRLDANMDRLAPIPGTPPSLISPPSGCPFHPRCRLRKNREPCVTHRPPLVEHTPGHASACHYHYEVPQLVSEVSEEMGIDLTTPAMPSNRTTSEGDGA